MRKKCISIFILLVTFVVAFVSCSDDDELLRLNNKTLESSVENKEYIDKVSLEIASFHDYVITYFANDVYQQGIVINEEFFNDIRTIMIDMSKSYGFKYLDASLFSNYSLSGKDLMGMYDKISLHDTLNVSIIDRYNSTAISLQHAERVSNDCIRKMEDIFFDSKDFDDFYDAYYLYVNSQLNTVKDFYSYLCIRFYTDMYMSSFTTWCNYIYADNAIKGSNNPSWWEKAKKKAKEVWNEVKPVVSADAQGAVAGAIRGAATGGVAGAGVGAAGGALGISAAKCVGNILGGK